MIVQWNARSLIANGQEFKGFVQDSESKPDVICVQESWSTQSIEFVIKGYSSLRSDRGEGNGGGCATFIKKGLQYRELQRGKELEYIITERDKRQKREV